MTQMTSVALRPVTDEDEEFLIAVYASTRADELALVPWTEEQKHGFSRMQFEAQRAHYRKYYPEATHDVILFEGRSVGRLYVARLEDEIRILDLAIMPESRRRGIATHLLSELMRQAAAERVCLSVHVEDFNPARALFEPLGFVPDSIEGIYTLMKWFPGGVKSSPDSDSA